MHVGKAKQKMQLAAEFETRTRTPANLTTAASAPSQWFEIAIALEESRNCQAGLLIELQGCNQPTSLAVFILSCCLALPLH